MPPYCERACAGRRMRPVTDRTHATLRVELDPQDGSIAGRLLDGEGAGRSFSGRVGLAAAIDDAPWSSALPTPPCSRAARSASVQDCELSSPGSCAFPATPAGDGRGLPRCGSEG